jgi:hypothetical protein
MLSSLMSSAVLYDSGSEQSRQRSHVKSADQVKGIDEGQTFFGSGIHND